MPYPLRFSLLSILCAIPTLASAQLYPGCPAPIDNFYKCERYKESQILKKEPTLAQRRANRLSINLASKGTLTLVDKPAKGDEDWSATHYSLSKTFPGSQFVEVSVSLYEGWDRYLVNRVTGEKVRVTGASQLSPDAKRFVVWTDDEADPVPFIRVYRIVGTTLELEFRSDKLPLMGPSKVQWVNNAEVAFKQFGRDDVLFRLTALNSPQGAPYGWRLSSTPSLPDSRR